MPPFIPKKHLASTPPASPKPTPVKKQKQNLADVLDAEAKNIPGFERKETFDLGSDDSESSLSDVDSDQFEHLAPALKDAANHKIESDDDDEEEGDFEDVELHKESQAESHQHHAIPHATTAPLQLKFDAHDGIDYSTFTTEGKKKGPTRQQKEVRARTHQLHVRYLLWHNAVRNAWICDKEVQQTLIAQLPAQIRKEVGKWERASGLSEQDDSSKTTSRKGKKKIDPRGERDWGRPNQRLDPGKPDMSRGDPLIFLLKILTAYWKKRFAITAPGLRKRGYGSKLLLKKDVESFRKDKHDTEKHGERIRNITEFRVVAKKCEGSRDVGAQLFTALLRGLGIESRLVASLQPAGFGFTKVEEMVSRKISSSAVRNEISDSSEDEVVRPVARPKSKPARASKPLMGGRKIPSRWKPQGNQESPIQLDSDAEKDNESDDDSIVDITPSMPKQRAPKYDRDLFFPIYWTEAISPITSQILPVDPLILEKPVVSTLELLSTFEPRGAKAENARLVMAYVVAYSDDGTAKDVTVRYLRKRIWPGKTKPFRFPIEKIPVYDQAGRIKRYEDYDWFKHIMSGYVRTDAMRAGVDDIEDSTDLVPQLPEKKDVDTSVDTLQSLKSSADFVLERFLRREEALRPGAKPNRTFISGKGDNVKSESVYRRADVERCLTAESWHKEGRHPKANEKPLKMVPVRAVTLTRKREAEEHERITGEKQTQGLYSWDQTEYIIPPPIKDGVVPKNSYGNIDCFVPSMVPRGAVHIPLRGTVRICKRLEIDFAEAVVGFEFGNKRAVPVIQGVVIPKESEGDVRKMWKEWNDEQQKKEAVKKEKLVLDLWRKFIVGLRIRERVGEMYGEELEIEDEPGNLSELLKRGEKVDDPIDVDYEDAEMAGPSAKAKVDAEDGEDMGGGFLLSDEDVHSDVEAEELVIEHHQPKSTIPTMTAPKSKTKATELTTAPAQYPTPVSMSSAIKLVTQEGKSRRRKKIIDETEDEDDHEDGDGEDSESELSPLPASKPHTSDTDNEDTVIDSSTHPSAHSESRQSPSTDSSSSQSQHTTNEEPYIPPSSARRRTLPAQGTQHESRQTRHVSSTSTPSQQHVKEGVTGKTSPYFSPRPKTRRSVGGKKS